MFSDDLEEMTAWAAQLDRSFVAIQGPPGTGKTFRAAHLVLALLRAGMRVGITAFSHSAIDNVLAEVIAVLDSKGELDLLNAVRKGSEPRTGALPNVTYTSSNAACARADFNVVAGTTWLFSGHDMASTPVDVLLVDEAGQLGLADALAASRAARNLVLLGDPLQLPQVAQAAHPGGSGRSVLEHVLGDDVTIPTGPRSVPSETRRMHPDVCSFISDEIYEGRLTSHASCEAARHRSSAPDCGGYGPSTRDAPPCRPKRPTSSRAEIGRLMGTPWTERGRRIPTLTARRLHGRGALQQPGRTHSASTSTPTRRTRGVPVGTVDKFQGRQAAVVFFTMTTSSSAEHVPRRGLPLLPQPAQRRDQPRAVPRLPRVHRGPTQQPCPRRRRHAPDLDTVLVRRVGSAHAAADIIVRGGMSAEKAALRRTRIRFDVAIQNPGNLRGLVGTCPMALTDAGADAKLRTRPSGSLANPPWGSRC